MKTIVERKNRTEIYHKEVLNSCLFLKTISINYLALKKVEICADLVLLLSKTVFDSMKNLKELHLELPKLIRLPGKLLFKLKKLEILILNVPTVNALPSKFLNNNSKLVMLTIYSGVTSIDVKLFRKVTKLENLQILSSVTNYLCYFRNLSSFNNKLKKLKIETNSTECYMYFKKTQKINLTNCGSCNFSYLINFKKLTKLNLKNSQSLINFDLLRKNTNLQVLILEKNYILDINFHVLRTLNNLRHLDFSECYLIDLKNIRFGIACPLLSYLSLRRNNLKIDQIHSELFLNLFYLQKLDLGYNCLYLLNDNKIFQSLLELKILFLNNNNLGAISMNCFENLKKLEVLDLSRNCLIKYTCFWFNSSIKYNLKLLKLNNNKITSICQNSFGPFPHLQHLNISSNRITRLFDENFKCLKSLRKLDLSNNLIRFLHCNFFKFLDNLNYLSLANNQLFIILPKTFSFMPNLRTLDLKLNLLVKPSVLRLIFSKKFLYLQTDFANYIHKKKLN